MLHILLTYTPRRAAKAGTVCAFGELCVLAEGNCSNHTQIKTSQYREQGYLNTGTEGGKRAGKRDWERGHAHTGAGSRTHSPAPPASVGMYERCFLVKDAAEYRHARVRTEKKKKCT